MIFRNYHLTYKQNISYGFTLATVFLGCSACIPQSTLPTATGKPAAMVTSTLRAIPATLTFTVLPTISLPPSDLVVLAIPNQQPLTGREGDQPPDWLGWGAETFTIAPDGSFWIADTAIQPQRLLHFSPQGELLKTVSLEGLLKGVYDLVATNDSLWVLEIGPQPPSIVHLGWEGDELSRAEVPIELITSQGAVIWNGMTNLYLGEAGEVLASTTNGLVELIDPQGVVTTRSLDGLSLNGHTYRLISIPSENRLSLEVDGAPVDLSPPYFIEADPFIGFNPDGSYALAVNKENPVEGDVPGSRSDWLVHYYTASGQLLGVARRWPDVIWSEFSHDLALGPDGSVYQLVSNADHSVQIVRLGFAPAYEALPEPTPESTPMPIFPELTPQLPAWETPPPGVSELEIARETLITFFSFLDNRRYAEAAKLYGGSYDEYAEIPFERLPGEDDATLWQRACSLNIMCMPVLEVVDENQVAEDEYLFFVEFLWFDGSRFQLGACCQPNPVAVLGVWQFAYPVKKFEGTWKVMRGPLYVP